VKTFIRSLPQGRGELCTRPGGMSSSYEVTASRQQHSQGDGQGPVEERSMATYAMGTFWARFHADTGERIASISSSMASAAEARSVPPRGSDRRPNPNKGL